MLLKGEDIKLYQHATSLLEGKKDPKFQKKPSLDIIIILHNNLK